MEILDDDLLHKITYDPNCQATFRAYKKRLQLKILMLVLILFIIAPLATKNFFSFLTMTSIEDASKFRIGMMIVICFVIVFVFFNLLQLLLYAVKDLLASKLNIIKDTLLEITPSDNNDCYIKFEKSGTLYGPSSLPNKEIPRNTVVYVIRTVYSKTLLDVIPIEKINTTP